ncbi:MAG: zinc ABC transporter substrate-binding protein [Spirochaetota bacterium]
MLKHTQTDYLLPPLRILSLCLLFLPILLGSCSKSPHIKPSITEPSSLPIVITSIAPYQFLLQELAGDYIEIINTSAQSADPHITSLTPEQTIQLRSGKLFFSLNPVEEQLILKSLGEQTQIVEMWQGIPLLSKQGGHSHPDEDHDNPSENQSENPSKNQEYLESWDEHFWLSPATLPAQIETMAQALETLLPEQRDTLQAGKERLLERNRELAQYLRHKLPQLQNGKIMSFHSALAYFAEFFNARQIFIEDQGIELGADEMLHLFEEAQELSFPLLIISPQFEQETAKTLAQQLELGVVPFNPQAPDIFESLSQLADALAQ